VVVAGVLIKPECLRTPVKEARFLHSAQALQAHILGVIVQANPELLQVGAGGAQTTEQTFHLVHILRVLTMPWLVRRV
jgi:hypothetical protein